MEPSQTTSLAEYEKCGAKLRGKTGLCRQPAGFRTNHAGQGRCWLHGGMTPIKSGRYSGVVRREISELLVKLEEEENPLNIEPELNIVRALLIDFINRYEENRDAVLAWYASWNGRPVKPEEIRSIKETLAEYEGKLRESGEWDEDPVLEVVTNCQIAQHQIEALELTHTSRPREVLDIADAYKMAAEATKIVERIEKIRARNAVSREDFVRIMTELGRTAETALAPAKLRSILFLAGIDVSETPEVVMIKAADDLRNTLSDLWMTIRVV